jgi:two-component system KDP operon response regulator KdpE
VVRQEGDAAGDFNSDRTRVIVIDDAPEFLALVTDLLADRNYEVLTSRGDDLDLEALVRFDPDLVVLDLRLQEVAAQLTGMEFLRLMRAHRILRQVPVIVCSADVGQLARNRETLASMPHCWVLPKPFGLEDFEATVADALRETRPPPEQPASPAFG